MPGAFCCRCSRPPRAPRHRAAAWPWRRNGPRSLAPAGWCPLSPNRVVGPSESPPAPCPGHVGARQTALGEAPSGGASSEVPATCAEPFEGIGGSLTRERRQSRGTSRTAARYGAVPSGFGLRARGDSHRQHRRLWGIARTNARAHRIPCVSARRYPGRTNRPSLADVDPRRSFGNAVRGPLDPCR